MAHHITGTARVCVITPCATNVICSFIELRGDIQLLLEVIEGSNTAKSILAYSVKISGYLNL
jgi:hypothetical protein